MREKKEINIQIGEQIRIARERAKLTQEQFAEALGLSWSFIALVESPNRVAGVSLETLFKMADVLEVEPYELLQK